MQGHWSDMNSTEAHMPEVKSQSAAMGWGRGNYMHANTIPHVYISFMVLNFWNVVFYKCGDPLWRLWNIIQNYAISFSGPAFYLAISTGWQISGAGSCPETPCSKKFSLRRPAGYPPQWHSNEQSRLVHSTRFPADIFADWPVDFVTFFTYCIHFNFNLLFLLWFCIDFKLSVACGLEGFLNWEGQKK